MTRDFTPRLVAKAMREQLDRNLKNIIDNAKLTIGPMIEVPGIIKIYSGSPEEGYVPETREQAAFRKYGPLPPAPPKLEICETGFGTITAVIPEEYMQRYGVGYGTEAHSDITKELIRELTKRIVVTVIPDPEGNKVLIRAEIK